MKKDRSYSRKLNKKLYIMQNKIREEIDLKIDNKKRAAWTFPIKFQLTIGFHRLKDLKMSDFDKFTSYKADWADILLIKLGVFAFALMIAKLWDPILSLDWYWYLIISLVAAVKPLKTFFQSI